MNVMENQTNVIQFPKKSKLSPPEISPTEVISNVNMIKYHHIEETLNTIVPMLFTNIELAGFSIAVDDDEEDQNIKNGALIVESIRALMCKLHNVPHPFINLADSIFIDTGEGSLELIKQLQLKMHEEEDSES